MTGVCNYEACNSLLLTQNTMISNKAESVRWNLLEWLVKASYNEIQQRKSRGLKFGITLPIKGVPVGFNLDDNFSEEDFKKLQNYIRAGRVEFFSEDKLDTFVSHWFDKEAYVAWSECMKNMINACSYGLQVLQVEYSDKDLAIKIRYVPEKMGDPYPKVTEFFVPENAECQAGCLKEGDEITGPHTILIKRNSDEQGTVLLLTDRGDVKVLLKKEEPQPKPEPEPEPKPIVITEAERQEAMRMLYTFMHEKYQEQYDNLGPGGIIRVEEFNADGSKVQLKILFHYVRRCPQILITPPRPRDYPTDSYMEGTIDLADLDSLDNIDASVTIQVPECRFPHIPGEERTLYIPWRRIAEKILSVVHKT
ncbi:hypothetical protein [Priestia megaterium]|uniref:hypothetical protein n=1 Tax=Priestia megaterium TaxID=1404 RepID=UPI0036724CEF